MLQGHLSVPCECPMAVVTNGPERGGLKQQKYILPVLEARNEKSVLPG